MKGINLHQVIRGAITAIHPDESVSVYLSTGNTNIAGLITPTYATPIVVSANVQMEGSAELILQNAAGNNLQLCRFYLYSDSANATRIQSIFRLIQRGGDYIKRADNTWWKVVSSPIDFSQEGWVCVVGALQLTGLTAAQIGGGGNV